jgi:8-oxo-dGTP pyrophosphatase MutT (NUDIX family)
VNRDPLLFRATELDTRCAPKTWTWAEENRPQIEAHWRGLVAKTPQLFNGRILLIDDLEAEGETVRATFFETDYAEFLGWRDFGYPDTSIINGFAMGALQGSDGGYVCGVMGNHTANPGRIYFAAGTPDRSDLREDGRVDLAASVLRELEEETGLTPDSFTVADHWIVVRHWPKIAFLRPVTFSEPADTIAARIRADIATQKDPELADVCVIRGLEDIDEERMPDFLRTFFRWAFGEGRGSSGSLASS